MSAGHAKFASDIRKAREAVTANAKQMNTAMSRVGRAFGSALGFAKRWGAYAAGAGAAAVAALTRQAINAADQMSKTAQAIGTTTERLSTLSEVAGYSSISFEEFARAMRNVARSAVDTVNGTGQARQAYSDLGIEVQDASGRLRASEDIMMEVANRFASMEDGAEKTRMAMRLFGERVGPQMIPMLNQGADGIERMEQRARDLGFEISTNTGRSAERFNDLLRELTRHSASWGRQLGETVLPTLIKITEEMNEAYIEGGFLASMWAGLTAAFRREGIGYIEADLNRVNREIERMEESGGLWQRFMLPAKHEERDALEKKLADALAESGQNAVQEALDRLRRERLRQPWTFTPEDDPEYEPKYEPDKVDDAELALRRLHEIGERRIHQMRQERDLFGANSRLQRMEWELQHGDLKDLVDTQKDRLRVYAMELDALDDLLDSEQRDEEQKLRAQHLMDRAMTQQQRYNRALDELHELKQAGLIVGDDYLNVLQHINEAYEDLAKSGKDAIGELQTDMDRWVDRSLDSLSRFAVYGAQSFKDFAQSVIQDLIRIQLQTQLTSIFGGIQFGQTPFVGDSVGNISTGSPVLPGLQRSIPQTPLAKPTQNIRVVNVLDPTVVNDWAQSAQGERVVMNVIRKNATQLREVV